MEQHGRLMFREFQKQDFDLFYSVFSNEQVMQYALRDRYGSREALLPYFLEVLENNKADEGRKAYEYAVFLACGGEFIGFADIDVYARNAYGGCAEIGYFILPGFWGRGYAAEIAGALLGICFGPLALHRVFACCNANNHRSERIMQKIGMQKEGEFPKARFKHGQWDNELRYAILAEEWKDLASKRG